MKMIQRTFSRIFFWVGALFFAFPVYAAGWVDPKTDPMESGLSKVEVSTVIKALMFWTLEIFGFLAIIAFVISGMLYLTAAGNDTQIKKAKAAMVWSIAGVIVGLLGYIVVKAADSWLHGESGF